LKFLDILTNTLSGLTNVFESTDFYILTEKVHHLIFVCNIRHVDCRKDKEGNLWLTFLK